MSRSTRPQTSLRLARSLPLIAALPRPGSVVGLGRWDQDAARWWGRLLGVRPAVLRRCILGRRVSLRAARRAEEVLVARAGELEERRMTGRWR